MDDEWMLDTPALREFIATVRETVATRPRIEEALTALKPHFAALLADPTWLPDTFRQPDWDSGMGSGIATWLIFCSGDGNMSLFALVVPPGAATPIHDHLAWGLVGLYAGAQLEEVYEQTNGAGGHGKIRLVTTNQLTQGEFYELLPPRDDIHRVTTTSATPSVSLHLLGNDTACVWRHRYDASDGSVTAFRSGYTNRPCNPTET